MDARDWREMSGVGRILFCSVGGVSERKSGGGREVEHAWEEAEEVE